MCSSQTLHIFTKTKTTNTIKRRRKKRFPHEKKETIIPNFRLIFGRKKKANQTLMRNRILDLEREREKKTSHCNIISLTQKSSNKIVVIMYRAEKRRWIKIDEHTIKRPNIWLDVLKLQRNEPTKKLYPIRQYTQYTLSFWTVLVLVFI